MLQSGAKWYFQVSSKSLLPSIKTSDVLINRNTVRREPLKRLDTHGAHWDLFNDRILKGPVSEKWRTQTRLPFQRQPIYGHSGSYTFGRQQLWSRQGCFLRQGLGSCTMGAGCTIGMYDPTWRQALYEVVSAIWAPPQWPQLPEPGASFASLAFDFRSCIVLTKTLLGAYYRCIQIIIEFASRNWLLTTPLRVWVTPLTINSVMPCARAFLSANSNLHQYLVVAIFTSRWKSM